MNDTSVLERLEEEFITQTIRKCQSLVGCDNTAIWRRIRSSCCGEINYTCNVHKYGTWRDGTPATPGIVPSGCRDGTLVHVPCGAIRTWVEVLSQDEWIRL